MDVWTFDTCGQVFLLLWVWMDNSIKDIFLVFSIDMSSLARTLLLSTFVIALDLTRTNDLIDIYKQARLINIKIHRSTTLLDSRKSVPNNPYNDKCDMSCYTRRYVKNIVRFVSIIVAWIPVFGLLVFPNSITAIFRNVFIFVLVECRPVDPAWKTYDWNQALKQ